MTRRRVNGWLVLVAILIGAADAGLRAKTPNENTAAGQPLGTALFLLLTTSSELPAVSRTALIREADSIWRDANVQLHWLKGVEALPPGNSLRVLVTPRTVASDMTGSRWAVGELVRFQDRGAVALASISSAERIVDESQAFQLLDVPAMRQYRLGVVLGRALAHEIGHYVLQTNTHAPYGLMRATIDAREFADLRSGAFRLDREAAAHLAARASGGVDPQDADFSYPQD